MNIVRTSGKGGRSEAALGPGRSRGGFPKIFPFSMAGADLPAFLGFRDGAFGFAPVPVSATGCTCSWPPISIGTAGVAGSLVRRACPPLTLAHHQPPPSLQEHWTEAAALGPLLVCHAYAWVQAGGSVNRRLVKAGMARSGSSAARTSSSE